MSRSFTKPLCGANEEIVRVDCMTPGSVPAMFRRVRGGAAAVILPTLPP
jgi:hypothetical protein